MSHSHDGDSERLGKSLQAQAKPLLYIRVRFDLSESHIGDSTQTQLFLLPCFPVSDASICSEFSSTSNKCRRRGQHALAAGCPLCQLRSVDIFHQTGADQRPACAHAGGRIKPHHAQPHRQKKPLYTSKEIKPRVKSNSRRIAKMGLYTWRGLCECDARATAQRAWFVFK